MLRHSEPHGNPETSLMQLLLVAVLAALVSACGPPAGAGDAVAADPLPIVGGRFEASGVIHVPGTNLALFVDDGRTREIFLMEFTADGRQAGGAARVPLGADVTDMEGITTDGHHIYVVGSQSKRQGTDGDGLVRFVFNADTRRIERVESVKGLKAWLAANVAELRGTERRMGDEVLNIEAVAWDPIGSRLLLGLRAPVVDGKALVVPVRLADSTAGLTRENLRADGPAIRLDLGGAGIRALEYDASDAAFRVVGGASLNDEDRTFEVARWDGRSTAPSASVGSWPDRLKPEGITRVTIGQSSFSLLVFDVGRFTTTR